MGFSTCSVAYEYGICQEFFELFQKLIGYCTIYRNSKPHNSILCHATISHPNNLDDAELAKYIMSHKTDSYDEVRFVDENDVSEFKTLTLDEIRMDSINADLNENKPFDADTCIMYFQDSIRGAING